MTPEPLTQTFDGLGLPEFDSTGFLESFDTVINADVYQERVQNLERDEIALLVEYLDEAFDRLKSNSRVSEKCLSELGKICGDKKLLPKSYRRMPQKYNRDQVKFWPGITLPNVDDRLSWKDDVLRYKCLGARGEVLQEFYGKVVIWKRLEDLNILPILRVDTCYFGSPQLTSDWIVGQNLREYINENPRAGRVALLRDVAQGLSYLHSKDVIHGGLKGTNVIVDREGRARITDFGIATVVPRPGPDQVYRLQWTAPENILGLSYTKESDFFSFGMVMIEALTGKVPYPDLQNNEWKYLNLWKAIRLTLKRPQRPAAISRLLWGIMESCWDANPGSRPSIGEVLQVLSGSATSWPPGLPEDSY